MTFHAGDLKYTLKGGGGKNTIRRGQKLKVSAVHGMAVPQDK